MTEKQKGVILELTEKEQRLIEKLREISYGQVVIYMQENQPVRIDRITESKKL